MATLPAPMAVPKMRFEAARMLTVATGCVMRKR